jgi:hypothetical protein
MTVIKYYDVATSTWKTGAVGAASGQVWPTVIGDGVSTSFQVTHGFGTRNVVVTVYRAAPPYDEVEVDVERTTESYVTIRTSPTVPAVGEYIAVVASAGTQATLDITMDSWHLVGGSGEPAFQNSWANNASPATYPVAAFRKDPTGRVALRGLVNGGPTGVAMFTLPVGYRPPRALFFPTDANGAYARITVNADGSIVHSAGATSNVNLNVIAFDTDTVLQTASLTAQPIESWHTVGASGEPVFVNAWVNDTGMVTKFKKMPDGRVVLAGRIKAGTIGQAVFTLPVGYRPAQSIICSTVSNNGSADIVSDVRIGTDGTVVPTVGSSSNWFTLEGIAFDTESVSAYASGVIGPTKVTALPTNPVDGQEIYYTADATNGIVWHLRYNAASASAYKWEFLGGAPIRAWDNNNYTFATGAGYNPPSAGVYVITALAGDYEVSFGSFVKNDSGASADLWTAVRIGATAAVDANGVDVYLPNGEYLSVARTVFVTQPTAGANLSLEHKNLAGNFNITVNRRFIAARPVRVG